MYKALYRHYRPVIFDDVFGQGVIVKTLKNSVINNSFSHAYMFFGPRGTGKTSLSKIFARSVNCLSPINGNACGKCDNCIISYNKECVDIIEIDAASNNGVDEIRELRNKISLVPAELKYKVYIIDEVHMLSIGAFNALLKTLEEPPEHVIFILATTDPQKIPETIISRCQCFSFKRISVNDIYSNLKKISELEKISIDDDVLNEIAITSNGGMRDALGMLDQLRSFCDKNITMNDYANVNGTITKNELDVIYNDIFNSNVENIIQALHNFNDSGKNIIIILENLMRFVRDKIIDFYVNKNNLVFDIKILERFVLNVNEKINDIKKSSNPYIYTEVFLINFINEYKIDELNKVNFKKINVDNDTSSITKIAENELNNITNNMIETVENKGKNQDLLPEKNIANFSKKSIINAKVPLNIDEIMDARINNTLASANKKVLLAEISNLNKFNDFTFDHDIGFICCSILDSKIRAASDENIILSYEYDSIVKQNIENINKITEVYNKITGSNKKIAIISDSKWDTVRKKYIDDLKNNVKYTLVEEPLEVFNEEEKDDIINNEAINLFGDIVEIN